MGLLERVKTGAEQAATRAKDEAREFQLRRELSHAYAELGRTALDLLDRAEIDHAGLTGPAARARQARSDLEAHERERAARGTPAGDGGAEGGGTPATRDS